MAQPKHAPVSIARLVEYLASKGLLERVTEVECEGVRVRLAPAGPNPPKLDARAIEEQEALLDYGAS